MSVQNIQIDGTGSFNDSTENAGVVSYAMFGDTATNSGTISVSAEFSLSAANHGTVTQVAVFVGDAVNTGTVAVAEFKDNAVNAGTVSTSAVFSDSTSNTGTVAAAEFIGNAVNDGGTVTGAASFADTAENIGSVGGNAVFADSAENKGSIAGDAIFADTTVNTGSVAGNAQVAATADNSGGTVTGNVTEYVPPSQYPAVGTVLSAGVVNYATVGGNQIQNGTYNVVADGNGGSSNQNYQYPSADTVEINNVMYTFDGNGDVSIASGVIYSPSLDRFVNFDGFGGWGAATEGTYQVANNKWYTISNAGNGVYPSGTLQASNNSWYTFDGAGAGVYASGIIADGANYYRYDGAGGRSQVYYISNIVLVTGSGDDVYSSSSVLAIGTITYASNGETNSYNFAVSDLSYTVSTESTGEIVNIVDTNPYN